MRFKYLDFCSGSGSGSGDGDGDEEGHEDQNEVPPEGPKERCNETRVRRCGTIFKTRRVCDPEEQPDPCSCDPCKTCPKGIGWQKFPGYSMSPRSICLCFNACPVSTSKGIAIEAGTFEMNTGELAAMIAKNATKLIAEKIIKAMQSVFTNEQNDR